MSDGALHCSAVVLSFNSARHLGACVESIAGAYREAGWAGEILVFENGSTDGSAALLHELEARYPGVVRGFYSPVNTGTTKSRNTALGAARGARILVMDADARIDARALATLDAVLDDDPRCGIAVPRLLYPDGRFQLSVDRFPTVTGKLLRALALRRLERRAGERAPQERTAVDYAISAVWLMRRELLQSVGCFDERIFYSPEDVDYCLRVWEAGWSIIYEPAASAVHDAQELSRRIRINRFTVGHALGLLYYFRKHRYFFGLDRLYRRIGRASA